MTPRDYLNAEIRRQEQELVEHPEEWSWEAEASDPTTAKPGNLVTQTVITVTGPGIIYRFVWDFAGFDGTVDKARIKTKYEYETIPDIWEEFWTRNTRGMRTEHATELLRQAKAAAFLAAAAEARKVLQERNR